MGERGAAGGEIRIVGAERPDGLELRTRGLAALGSPELRVSGLAPYLGQGWARVLAALARLVAQRLSERHGARPGAAGGDVPSVLQLTPDIAVALKVEDGDLVPVPPRELPDPGADLRTDPGKDPGTDPRTGPATGSESEWRREVLLALFPAAHS